MGKTSFWNKVKKVIPAAALTVAMSTGTVLAVQPSVPGVPENNDSYQNRYIDVQLLGINDLHGQLDTTGKVGGKPVGRADYLAAYLKQREAENPQNTLLIHAGDAVGASPPVSALLQDEPTIEILNELGFDVGTVGNHEFDEGVAEMKRLIYGGYHEKTGYFEGANFPYVAANVIDDATGETVLPPYVVKKVNGMPIAFIGVVFSDTPTIVTPSGTAGVHFTDEAEAINKAVAELKEQGVRSIVVLAHNPVTTVNGKTTGELADIAMKVDDEVDVLFGAHDHRYANGVVDGKLIVQAYSYGTAFSDVDLKIDPRTKDIVSKKAEIVTTYQDGIAPDPTIKSMIESYQAKVGPIINQVIGNTTTEISRDANANGEIPLGDMIADSMIQAMNSEIAFMNPGGIRAGINAGEITWGELFTVQPFGNDLVKMTLTGDQIKRLFEQQWQDPSKIRILQIAGLTYTYDVTKPYGQKVQSISLANGTPLDPAKEYTVTTNNFLAGGGDSFTVFKEGKNQVVGPVDLDALIDFIKLQPNPFTYEIKNRITKL